MIDIDELTKKATQESFKIDALQRLLDENQAKMKTLYDTLKTHDDCKRAIMSRALEIFGDMQTVAINDLPPMPVDELPSAYIGHHNGHIRRSHQPPPKTSRPQ